MATGEGRRGPPTRRLFPIPSLWPIPTLRRMPTTDITAMADGIIPTMDTPGPTTTVTTGLKFRLSQGLRVDIACELPIV